MRCIFTVLLLLSCSGLASADVNPFYGSWIAAGSGNNLTRLSITREDGEPRIEAWGSLQAPDADWKQTDLTCFVDRPDTPVPNRALAAWDNAAAHTVLVLKFGADADHLMVETFTTFKGGSGRANYATELTMVRSPQT